MKTLIVEDDFTSRTLLSEILGGFGPCHIAVNGKEAVEAVRMALDSGEPYNLICMDIMMPEMDGLEALREIRKLEEDHGILSSKGAKIIMATALDDSPNIFDSFRNLCDAYIVKPFVGKKLFEEIRKLKLIE